MRFVCVAGTLVAANLNTRASRIFESPVVVFDHPGLERSLTHAKFVWDAAVDSPITGGDVDGASPRADEQLRRSFFSPRYDRATPAERRYMHAMASLGDDQYATPDVAKVLSRRPADVSVQRDGLLNKGLVYAAGP